MAYIDKAELVRNLDRFASEHLTPLVRMLIENQPTADVVEVKHGYWKDVTTTKDNTVCGNNAKIRYKICSNCEEPMGLTGADFAVGAVQKWMGIQNEKDAMH